MKKPTISLDVVVPCYNEEFTIAACLNALLAQGNEINHIIIVENNSTDNTVSIVKQYQKKYPSIILLKEKRQGVQFARNAGFNKASADIIARIDVDTVVQLGWAQAICAYYASHPKLGAACGDSIHHDIPLQKASKLATDFVAQTINRKFADAQWLYGANMSIRRATWQLIKNEVCMNNGIAEDQDLHYHVKQVGATTAFIPDAVAYVSGRRIRMSPLRYWRYNAQLWRTYQNHDQKAAAFRIRAMVWLVNVLHFFAWFPLQFHDPAQKRFRLGYVFEPKTERKIP